MLMHLNRVIGSGAEADDDCESWVLFTRFRHDVVKLTVVFINLLVVTSGPSGLVGFVPATWRVRARMEQITFPPELSRRLGGFGDEGVPVNAPAPDVAPARPSLLARPLGGVRLGVVLFVTALNLRMAIAALSPVLGYVQRDTGMSSAGAGLLSTMPVVCFGLFALAAPRLIRRFGMERLLVGTLVVIAAGIALRILPAMAALFGGTAVIGMAIAVGNVLFPGLIKQDFPDRTALMTGLYSVSLFVGPAISGGLTVPVMNATGLDWRSAIAIWGGLALLCVALLAPHAAARPPRAEPALATASVSEGSGQQVPRTRRIWADPVAWMVASFMGLQSLGYYAVVAWIPTVFQAHAMSASQAGWMLSYLSFPGLTASLVTPLIVRGRAGRAAVMVVVATAACGAGYLGLALAAASMPYLWITALGIGQGMCISLALGFVVARAPDVAHTARLSTMTQSVGYLIASIGPFGLGALHDLTHQWRVPLLALSVILLPMLVTGIGASRDRYVLASAPAGRARYRGAHRAPKASPGGVASRFPGRSGPTTGAQPAVGQEPASLVSAVPSPRQPSADLLVHAVPPGDSPGAGLPGAGLPGDSPGAGLTSDFPHADPSADDPADRPPALPRRR